MYPARSTRRFRSFYPIALGALTLAAAAHGDSQNRYLVTNMVSSVPGLALTHDPLLINPWGMSFSATSPFWVSNQGSGTSTLYNGAGVKQALTVTIPTPGFPGHSNPAGQVFNATPDFKLDATRASIFIFATLEGTISGWHPAVNPTMSVITVNNPGSVYTGLAKGSVGANNFLYAANFSMGRIDVFDKNWQMVNLAGPFTNPDATAGGYSPFNIQNLGGKLYVTYAKFREKHGVVAVFDTNGNSLGTIVKDGLLNEPWGLAFAPANFGKFGGKLLVGNLGDGRILAVDPDSHEFLGVLRDAQNRPIVLPGLWQIMVGNGGNGGSPSKLYFAAGIFDETEGLFGSIEPAP